MKRDATSLPYLLQPGISYGNFPEIIPLRERLIARGVRDCGGRPQYGVFCDIVRNKRPTSNPGTGGCIWLSNRWRNQIFDNFISIIIVSTGCTQ